MFIGQILTTTKNDNENMQATNTYALKTVMTSYACTFSVRHDVTITNLITSRLTGLGDGVRSRSLGNQII